MYLKPLPLILLIGAICGAAAPAFSQDVKPTTQQPTSQFYLLSFTDVPIAEVAEAVIGGSLNEAFTVDPVVEGTMSFKAEGGFTADALLQEFGTALMDQDVALIRLRDRSLSVVPRENLALSVAKGASLIALPAAGGAPSAAMTKDEAPRAPVVYGADRWWEGAIGGLLLFVGGAISGAAALFGGQWIWRRQVVIATDAELPMLRLEARKWPVEADTRIREDDDLIIPRFDERP